MAKLGQRFDDPARQRPVRGCQSVIPLGAIGPPSPCTILVRGRQRLRTLTAQVTCTGKHSPSPQTRFQDLVVGGSTATHRIISLSGANILSAMCGEHIWV